MIISIVGVTYFSMNLYIRGKRSSALSVISFQPLFTPRTHEKATVSNKANTNSATVPPQKSYWSNTPLSKNKIQGNAKKNNKIPKRNELFRCVQL